MQNSFETPPIIIYVDYHTHVETFDVGWKTGYEALVLEVKDRFAFHSSDDFFLSCLGNGGDASPGLITVNSQDALDAFLAKAPTLPPLLTLHPAYPSLGRTFTIEMGAHPSYELFEIHAVLEMPTRLDILRLAKSRFNALPAPEEIELYLVSRGGLASPAASPHPSSLGTCNLLSPALSAHAGFDPLNDGKSTISGCGGL